MSWITDRLPNESDVDVHSSVLVPAGGPNVRAFLWENTATIKLGDPWLPAPPAYAPPKTRDELVQDLLDAIDDEGDYDIFQVAWRLKVIKAREKLK